MKIIYVLLLFAFCLGCKETSETYSSGNYKNISTMINRCKAPVVVVAIGEQAGHINHAKILLVVIDSTGTTYSCSMGGALGLQIGDTLKYSKR